MGNKICIISGSPNFLGGVSLYTKDLVNLIKESNKNKDIYWVYSGENKKEYKREGIKYSEFKTPRFPFLEHISFDTQTAIFLNKNNFDIINSHGFSGLWMNFFKKRGTFLVHTFHGSTYYFYKNHFKRFGIIKRIIYLPTLLLSYLVERVPWKKADEIICVSEHVKKELESLYGKRGDVRIVHARVDVKSFRPRNKQESKKKIGLNRNNWYGLYVGRGGFWTKGLDRVINISREIHKINKNYKLLVIGPDMDKIKDIAKEDFVIISPPINRENLPYYYNSSDIFFNLSRYEGGDPTLATAEAMASGCLVVCSKDSKQEIIKNDENGIVLKEFTPKTAKILLNEIKNKKIIRNSIKIIQKFSK